MLLVILLFLPGVSLAFTQVGRAPTSPLLTRAICPAPRLGRTFGSMLPIMSTLGDSSEGERVGERASEPVVRRKVSPLIASLLEDAPQAPVRQTLSAAEMAELTAAAAGASEEGRIDQRRRATLALASPLLGAAAFLYRFHI
jgi:hypothetical protein